MIKTLTSIVLGLLISCLGICQCSIVADYEFTGNTNDASSYNLTATDVGATLVPDRFGNPNSAYSFNGTSNYIIADTNNRGVTNRVTVSAWIQTTSTATMGIAEKYRWEQDRGYSIAVINNKAQFSGRDGSGEFYEIQSQVSVNDGQWHLITGVYRGAQWELWVDGVLENKLVTGNTAGQLANPEPLSIGIDYDSKTIYFDGGIDEVKLWNCALDSATIASMYSKPPVLSGDTATIALTGDQITSVEVRMGQYSNTNLSYTVCLAVWAITVNSQDDIGRSFLQFDYSGVPSNATTITKATLYLYSDTTQPEVGNIPGATQYSGSNNWEIYRATSAWSGSTITWNNQPSSDTIDHINMPATTSAFENYTVDLTKIVQSEINNPSSAYGIVLQQALESPYRGLAFLNANGPTALQPKLVIQYLYNNAGSVQPTSITSAINSSQITVFPSPTSDVINIQGNTQNISEIAIADYTGQALLNVPFSSQLSVSNLRTGVYVILFKGTGGSVLESLKFVKE